MKYYLLSLLCIHLFIGAQITKEQKEIISPYVNKIIEALPVLEQDRQITKAEHEKNVVEYNALQEQLSKASSVWDKGVINTKLTYYATQDSLVEKKLKQQEMQLTTYYCILDVFNKRQITDDEIKKGKTLLPNLEEQYKSIQERQKSAVTRKYEAEKRLQEIPGEESSSTVTLTQLQKKLALLEEKKTWSNLTERTQLNTEIAFHNAKLLKLKAELVVQEKIVEDSVEELKSLLREKTETEIALAVIN